MIGTLPGMPSLVALDLPGGPAFVDALLRVWDRGDAAMPLDRRLPQPAAQAVLDALRPGAIIGADGERRSLAGGRPVDPGDALVLATSGSTGQPKGVVLTRDAVAASAHATNTRLAVDPATDIWLACLPLAHIGGLAVVTRALHNDTPVRVFDRFDPSAVGAAAASSADSGRSVLVSLVAAALSQVDVAGFRAILLGGAAPPGALPEQVVVTYGMTETGSGLVYDGIPLDGAEIAVEPVISDETRFPVPDDQFTPPTDQPTLDEHTGQILVRGPMLFRAYRDERPARRADGWFATGDAGHIDSDGRLHVLGRIAEVIVTGGEKVWPAHVERILGTLPGVGAVAVAGYRDQKWGQRVVAYVVPRRDVSPPALEEVRAAVKTVAAPWAAPRQLVIVPDLPRTANGKVRRSALAALTPPWSD